MVFGLVTLGWQSAYRGVEIQKLYEECVTSHRATFDSRIVGSGPEALKAVSVENVMPNLNTRPLVVSAVC